MSQTQSNMSSSVSQDEAPVCETEQGESVTQSVSQPYGNAAAAQDAGTRRRGGLSHPVAEGESLWSIAESVYDDGSHWREIEDANPVEVKPGHLIIIGDALMVPIVAVGEGQCVEPEPDGSHAAITRGAWFAEQLANGADATAIQATLGRLSEAERAAVVADPSTMLAIANMPLAAGTALMASLGADAWVAYVTHRTDLIETLDTTLVAELQTLIQTTERAVGDVRAVLSDNARFAAFVVGYSIAPQQALLVAGLDVAAQACGGALDFDLLIRICTDLPSAERQEALLAVRRAGEWEPMLDALGPGHVGMVQSWLGPDVGDGTDQSLEDRIAAAHNSARGQAALAKVDAVRAADTNVPGRIADRVRELLVLAVALPRSETNDLLSEGVMGVDQAERAAQALVRMPVGEYLRTIALLELTGDQSRLLQSFNILKACGARLGEFQAGGSNSTAELEDFCDSIRDMDEETVIRNTTVQQTDAADIGMEQQFSMSCAPTSAVVLRSEADPIEALRHRTSNDMSVDETGGDLAREMEGRLEAQGAGVVAHTRSTNVPDDVNQAITDLTGTVPAARLQAVARYMAGNSVGPGTFTQADYDAGIAAIRTHLDMAGYPNDQAMRLEHETAAARTAAAAGTAPANVEGGYGVAGVTNDLNGALGVDDVTGVTYAATFTAPIIQNGIAWTATGAANGLVTPLPAAVQTQIAALLSGAATSLESGNDVEIGVWWTTGGAHAMSFLNVRGAGAGRDFLVHDTWSGSTAWVPQASIVLANWPGITANQGLLGATFH